jgi:hypothetical protein
MPGYDPQGTLARERQPKQPLGPRQLAISRAGRFDASWLVDVDCSKLKILLLEGHINDIIGFRGYL